MGQPLQYLRNGGTPSGGGGRAGFSSLSGQGACSHGSHWQSQMPAAVLGQCPSQGSEALCRGQAELAGLRARSWQQGLGEEAPEL